LTRENDRRGIKEFPVGRIQLKTITDSFAQDYESKSNTFRFTLGLLGILYFPLSRVEVPNKPFTNSQKKSNNSRHLMVSQKGRDVLKDLQMSLPIKLWD
jgi:hypothetical protein